MCYLYGGCLSSAVCVQPSSLWLLCALCLWFTQLCAAGSGVVMAGDGVRNAFPGAEPCSFSGLVAFQLLVHKWIPVLPCAGGVQPPASSQGGLVCCGCAELSSLLFVAVRRGCPCVRSVTVCAGAPNGCSDVVL